MKFKTLFLICAVGPCAIMTPASAQTPESFDPSKCEQKGDKFSCPPVKLTWTQFLAYEKKIGAITKTAPPPEASASLTESLNTMRQCSAPCIFINGICSCEFIILPSSEFGAAEFDALKAATSAVK